MSVTYTPEATASSAPPPPRRPPRRTIVAQPLPQAPPAPQAPSAPPQAPIPPADAGYLTYFNPVERDYVQSLKRKERTDLFKVLTNHKRRPPPPPVPLRIQVLQSTLPMSVRRQIFEDLRVGVHEKYIQWVRKAIRLPLDVIHKPPNHADDVGEQVARARRVMDTHISGQDAAKQEVLQLVCQQYATKGEGCRASYSLGLEGPPGTGKTHFVRTAMAEALQRPFVSIPLGGATDSAFLLGNLYTYEGSKEGRLAAALLETNCCNPIIHFDELDKVSEHRGAEIISTLIHLIDPVDSVMRDRYFHGIDIDYSRCTFVFSYNDASLVSPILLDRIKRVSMNLPTAHERRDIATRHLVPRIQGRLRTGLDLCPEALAHILESHAATGLRGVEKDIDRVLAAAQLSVWCADDGQLDVLTPNCKVSLAFAKRTLATSLPAGSLGSSVSSSAAISSMYL